MACFLRAIFRKLPPLCRIISYGEEGRSTRPRIPRTRRRERERAILDLSVNTQSKKIFIFFLILSLRYMNANLATGGSSSLESDVLDTDVLVTERVRRN